jgi:hypothetical protein
MDSNIYENIYKSFFQVKFDFKDLELKESQYLERCFMNIKETTLSFELLEIDGKVQPLDIIVKLKNNHSRGNITIMMTNKDAADLGTILFEGVEFTDIQNLINFDVNTDTYNKESAKDITVNINHDNIYYNGLKI